MKKTVIHHDDACGFGLTLTQTSLNRFTVTYGLQVKANLPYDKAAKEYGKCLFHALVCEDKIKVVS